MMNKKILLVVIVLQITAIFFFWGNSSDTHLLGTSLFSWLTARWSESSKYSFSYIVPFISAWLIWHRRTQLKNTLKAVDKRGLYVVISAILLHILALRLEQPRLSALSLILILWAVPFYLYGVQTARLLVFPLSYLIFCIPLNFLDVLSFPLRLFASYAAGILLNGLGISVIREGTAIISCAEGGFRLEIADACSGLNYLVALVAVAALFANIFQKQLWKQYFIFVSSIPIAVLANIIRILVIAACSSIFGSQTGEIIYHNASGYIVFISAILFLFLINRILNTHLLLQLKRK